MKKNKGLTIEYLNKNYKNLSSHKKFFFYIVRTDHLKKISFSDKLFTTLAIYVVNTKLNSQMLVNDGKVKKKLVKNESYEILNCKNLCFQNKSEVFLAGTYLKKKLKFKFEIKSQNYKVKKPWGYELWINNPCRHFSLKKIFIKKTHRTSLQYHKKKFETMFLLQGKIELNYKKKKITNKFITKKDLGSIMLKKNSIINIKPNNIHRVNALSDINLIEASTPELSDVIRIQDDNMRKSGFISKEHPSKK